jgi:hypothetical protein
MTLIITKEIKNRKVLEFLLGHESGFMQREKVEHNRKESSCDTILQIHGNVPKKALWSLGGGVELSGVWNQLMGLTLKTLCLDGN